MLHTKIILSIKAAAVGGKEDLRDNTPPQIPSRQWGCLKVKPTLELHRSAQFCCWSKPPTEAARSAVSARLDASELISNAASLALELSGGWADPTLRHRLVRYPSYAPFRERPRQRRVGISAGLRHFPTGIEVRSLPVSSCASHYRIVVFLPCFSGLKQCFTRKCAVRVPLAADRVGPSADR